MKLLPKFSSFRDGFDKPPFWAQLLTAAAMVFWAVQIFSPLPAPLVSDPFATADSKPQQALQPAALWQTEVAQKPKDIRVLALLGGASGRGRVVLAVDGKSIAANTQDSPFPGWRVLAVRSDAVDLEIDGKLVQLKPPLPMPGREIVPVH